MKIYYDKDADIQQIRSKTVAVIGAIAASYFLVYRSTAAGEQGVPPGQVGARVRHAAAPSSSAKRCHALRLAQ